MKIFIFAAREDVIFLRYVYISSDICVQKYNVESGQAILKWGGGLISM